MKKQLVILCSCILALSLTACGADFDGSRTGNSDEFVMDYKILNKTDAQDLMAEKGDTIHAEIIVEGGSLSLKVRMFPFLMNLMLRLRKAERIRFP